MRNRMEGHFTKWHTDIAYPHLYAAFLKDRYAHVPHPDAVLQWRREREQLLHQLDVVRVDDGTHWKERKQHESDIESQLVALSQRELKWAPPAHLSRFGTPIPLQYFTRAAGSAPWQPWSCTDLVPFP